MDNYDDLIQKVAKNNELFWQGRVDIVQINKLEQRLNVKLPPSFRDFLEKFGGGGVVEEEISGIEDNDASLLTGGTVLGDTLNCRKSYGLPLHLVVIFYNNDEIVWCLDTSSFDENEECKVVSYSVFDKKVDNVLAENFDLFFKEYLELRME